jgi:hypothetical protein
MLSGSRLEVPATELDFRYPGISASASSRPHWGVLVRSADVAALTIKAANLRVHAVRNGRAGRKK